RVTDLLAAPDEDGELRELLRTGREVVPQLGAGPLAPFEDGDHGHGLTGAVGNRRRGDRNTGGDGRDGEEHGEAAHRRTLDRSRNPARTLTGRDEPLPGLRL